MGLSTYDRERLLARKGGVALSDVVERFCMTGVNAGKPGPCPSGVADVAAGGDGDSSPVSEHKTKESAETALLGAKYKLSHAKGALAKAPPGSAMHAMLTGKVSELSNQIDALNTVKDSLPSQPHPESYIANKKVLAVKSNISKTAKKLKEAGLDDATKKALTAKLDGLKIEEAEAQKAKKAALAKEKAGGKVPPSVAKVVTPDGFSVAKAATSIKDAEIEKLDFKVHDTLMAAHAAGVNGQINTANVYTNMAVKAEMAKQELLGNKLTKENVQQYVDLKSGEYLKAHSAFGTSTPAEKVKAQDEFQAAAAVKDFLLNGPKPVAAGTSAPAPVASTPTPAPFITPGPAAKAKPPFDPAKLDTPKKMQLSQFDKAMADQTKILNSHASKDPLYVEASNKFNQLKADKETLLNNWKAKYEAGTLFAGPVKSPGTSGFSTGTSIPAVAPMKPKVGKLLPGHDAYPAPPANWHTFTNKNYGKLTGNHFTPPESSVFTTKAPESITSLKAYTGNSYASLNKALYNDESLSPHSKAIHKGIQKAFAVTPTFSEPITVMRGIDAETPEFVQGIMDSVKKSKDTGEPLVFKGYASTSTNPSVATSFAGGYNTPAIVLKINAVRGLDLRAISHFGHESEVLLNAGSKFDVKNIQYDPASHKYVVHLDQRKDEGFAENETGIYVNTGLSHEEKQSVSDALAMAARDNDDAYGEAADIADWLNDRAARLTEREAKTIAQHFQGTGLTLVVDDDDLWTVEEVDYAPKSEGSSSKSTETNKRVKVAAEVPEGKSQVDSASAPSSKVQAAKASGKTDLEAAERLTASAVKSGANVLAQMAKSVMHREGLDGVLAAKSMFTDAERETLADSIAATNSTAELMGRARIRLRQAAAGVIKHSEPTDFAIFAEEIKPLAPEAALTYFKDLVPTIGIKDPQKYADGKRRQAFTLAVDADKVVLQRVQDVIKRVLEEGLAVSAAKTIDRILDDAGLSTKNPQYAEMVYRTNAKDAYNEGADEERQDPDVAETFPVWQYVGIEDGRQREEHQVHFDRFFPNSVKFSEVRDSAKGTFDGFNCRCDQVPVSKWEWRDLQAKGARIAGGYDSFAERIYVFCQEGENTGKPGPCPGPESNPKAWDKASQRKWKANEESIAKHEQTLKDNPPGSFEHNQAKEYLALNIKARTTIAANAKEATPKAGPKEAATPKEAAAPKEAGTLTAKYLKGSASVPTPEHLAKVNSEIVSKGGKALEPDEAMAVSAYVGDGYLKFSNLLRGLETFKPGGKKEAAFKAAVASLDSAIDKLPKHEGNVTRVLAIHDPSKLLEKYKPGSTVSEANYTSTTLGDASNVSIGVTVVKPNITFKIKSKTGSLIPDSMVAYGNEREVLFGRDTPFLVKQVTKVKDAVKSNGWDAARPAEYVIEMEETAKAQKHSEEHSEQPQTIIQIVQPMVKRVFEYGPDGRITGYRDEEAK